MPPQLTSTAARIKELRDAIDAAHLSCANTAPLWAEIDALREQYEMPLVAAATKAKAVEDAAHQLYLMNEALRYLRTGSSDIMATLYAVTHTEAELAALIDESHRNLKILAAQL